MPTGDAVRLEPRPFRPWPDGIVGAAFVIAIVFCVVGAIVWGQAAFVLGAVYATMGGLVWLEAFRSSWAIGDDELGNRRWTQWRYVRSEDVRAVSVDEGEPGIDLSIGAPHHRRVVVPLDDWRRRPGAVERLREFLAHAEATGARVDESVWRAVGTTPTAH
jgi:hypothetical protein